MCNYRAMPDAIRLSKLLTQMYIGTPTRGTLIVTLHGATGDCLLLVSYDVIPSLVSGLSFTNCSWIGSVVKGDFPALLRFKYYTFVQLSEK